MSPDSVISIVTGIAIIGYIETRLRYMKSDNAEVMDSKIKEAKAQADHEYIQKLIRENERLVHKNELLAAGLKEFK